MNSPPTLASQQVLELFFYDVFSHRDVKGLLGHDLFILSEFGFQLLHLLSISNFQRQFWDFDYSQFKDFHFSHSLRILSPCIAENVNEEDAQDREFQKHLQELITYLRNGPQAPICNIGTFWMKSEVTAQIQALSEKEDYIFVPLSDLSHEKSNLATGQFVDSGVGAHPSDKGMKEIADRIAGTLGIF